MDKSLKITDLSHDGRGVGRLDGRVLFVAGALPGETVTVKNVRSRKRYGEGELASLLLSSPDRISPPCPWFPRCGGCDLQHYAYAAGLEWKRKRVQGLFDKAGVDGCPGEVYPMPVPWHYRNHVQLQVKDGTIGFYGRKSHRIVPVDACLIQSLEANRILSALHTFRYAPGTEKIIVRTGDDGVLVGFAGDLPIDFEPDALLHAGATGIWQKPLTKSDWENLAGEDGITLTIGRVRYPIAPNTFFQVNTEMANLLFQRAIDLMDCSAKEKYLDLYCGMGAIALQAAPHAKHITGIEISSRAVELATETAKRNRIENVAFLCARSEQGTAEAMQRIHPAGVFVDPPRAGLDKKLIQTLLKSAVERIVYVSCDPATLARDLKHFQNGGWTVDRVELFDMFPWSVHVETIARIQRG